MLEGKLNKWTNVISQWQTRWVVLENDLNLLSYYTSREKMMKGVRRGCVRLRGASIGIDDQDALSFTITVDHKTFHFQARSGDEREKWVQHLEETIKQNANKRGNNIDKYNLSGSCVFATQQNLIRTFDRKVSEADVYLQLIIEKIAAIDKRIEEIEDEDVKSGYVALQKQFSCMLDNIKHSIVLLQIAKNTALPINGTFTGQILSNIDETSSQCIDMDGGSSNVLEFPETSYSSSEGEDDYFDAHDIPSTSSQLVSPSIGVNDSFSEEQFMTCDENLNVSKSTSLNNDISNEDRRNIIPLNADGSINYDAIYEDENDNDISFETQRSVVGALLSQVKIGMDLTKVVLPTFILERRSLLEMYADYFAHPDLFLRIADMKCPKTRMIQVVRWYLSAYHAGRKKSDVAKKPYNPILGEIFRCHWNVPEFETPKNITARDGPVPWCRTDQLTFIAEQVSHHPPISAFYAEHIDKRISFCAHVWTKSKFLGLSIGVHNVGQGIVYLTDHKEEYVVTFPNGYGRSILTIPWIELGGSVSISCKQTGYRAEIEFLTKPFYGGKRNRIQAEIYSPNERKSFMSIQGEWSGLMEAKWNDGSKAGSEVFVDVNRIPIFKKQVKPIAEQEDYESRNIWREVTLGLKINDIEKATAGKFRIEQKQREEAKSRKEGNNSYPNKYFSPDAENWHFSNPLSKRLDFKTTH